MKKTRKREHLCACWPGKHHWAQLFRRFTFFREASRSKSSISVDGKGSAEGERESGVKKGKKQENLCSSSHRSTAQAGCLTARLLHVAETATGLGAASIVDRPFGEGNLARPGTPGGGRGRRQSSCRRCPHCLFVRVCCARARESGAATVKEKDETLTPHSQGRQVLSTAGCSQQTNSLFRHPLLQICVIMQAESQGEDSAHDRGQESEKKEKRNSRNQAESRTSAFRHSRQQPVHGAPRLSAHSAGLRVFAVGRRK